MSRLENYAPSIAADPRQPDPRRKGIPPSPPIPGQLDRGIRKAVERLQASGIETFESCEGGQVTPTRSLP